MDKTVRCRTVEGDFKEVPVTELSFRPSVYGVVIKDEKVLLVPQWDGYDIPGGGVDLGELLTETLVREVREETGFDVQPIQILHVEDDFFFHPHKKRAYQTPLIYFTCEITGGELSDEGFDEREKEYAKKAEWIPLQDVSSLKFHNAIDAPKLIQQAHNMLKK